MIVSRISALQGWRRFGLAVLSGALFALGHAPVGIPAVGFLALPVLVLLSGTAARPRSAFWAGWGFGFGYFVVSLHWIGHAFLVDAEAFAWMLPFALTGLPALLGLFWGAAGWLTHRLAPLPQLQQPPLALVLRTTLTLAATLTLADVARSHVLTGFPWALTGYVWVDTPVVQLSAWIGPHGVSFVTLVLASLPVLLVLTCPARLRIVAPLLPLAALTGLWALGSVRLAAETPDAPDAPVIRLAQPNAPQHLKWDPDYAPVFYQRLMEATAAPAGPLGPPDMVIWPETAVAFLLAESETARQNMAAAAGRAPLLTGAIHRHGDGSFANSLFVLDPEGAIAARYDKHHLVPFGEYVPFQSLFGALGLRQLAQRGRFVPGPGPEILAPAGLPSFAALICYEAIFPTAIVPGDQRPRWLLQITNDAWFGTLGGPQQHLAQARMRAIEQGLPMVRAANTGISAVIDARGRITASLGLDQHGGIDARLPAALPATFYVRFGDLPALLLSLLPIFACFVPLHTRGVSRGPSDDV
ncbi:MAG: apolipoprotein N-acyltransferase [Pseudomonadota bacterium]